MKLLTYNLLQHRIFLNKMTESLLLYIVSAFKYLLKF